MSEDRIVTDRFVAICCNAEGKYRCWCGKWEADGVNGSCLDCRIKAEQWRRKQAAFYKAHRNQDLAWAEREGIA